MNKRRKNIANGLFEAKKEDVNGVVAPVKCRDCQRFLASVKLCRYWDRVIEDEDGFCHRAEPREIEKSICKICFTYKMSKPHKTIESCVTLPLPEDIAYEVLQKGRFSQFLGSNSALTNIFVNLAQLQGCTFAGVVKAEDAETKEALQALRNLGV